MAEENQADFEYSAAPEECSLFDADNKLRGQRILWLGIILILGAVMPIFAGFDKVIFINFEILGEGHAPALMKFMAIYPLLAGLTVVALGAMVAGVPRSAVLCVLGLVPVVVLMSDANMARTFSQMTRQGGGFNTQAIIGLLGWAGVLIGSRILRYRWWSRIGGVVAAVGAVLVLAQMLVPVSQSPFRPKVIPILAPYDLLSTLPVIGVGRIIQHACMLAAAILCVVSLFKRDAARSLGAWVFTLWIWALVAATVGIFAQFLGPISQAGLQICAMTGLAIVKFGCWIGGIMLLLPVGVTDLTLNLIPTDAQALSEKKSNDKPIAIFSAVMVVVMAIGIVIAAAQKPTRVRDLMRGLKQTRPASRGANQVPDWVLERQRTR